MEESRNPSPKEVQLIYKDTYNFYLKWLAVKEPNWEEVIIDSRGIEATYPFDLCRKILVEIIAILEKSYMERKSENVKE